MFFYTVFLLTGCRGTSQPDTAVSKSLYDIPLKAIDGTDINLNDFAGKKILFVNVAIDVFYSATSPMSGNIISLLE